MTDEEVDALLSGVEDNQGQVNYEGKHPAEDREREKGVCVCVRRETRIR